MLNIRWPLVGRCNDGTLSLAELDEVNEHDREITYRTFARKVDIGVLSAMLGYTYGRSNRGVRLSEDWHVRFYRSKLNGKPCYHLEWSAVDHVFQPASDAPVRIPRCVRPPLWASP